MKARMPMAAALAPSIELRFATVEGDEPKVVTRWRRHLPRKEMARVFEQLGAVDLAAIAVEQEFEAALRGAREVGHKPQSELKLGRPRGKGRKAPKAKGGR